MGLPTSTAGAYGNFVNLENFEDVYMNRVYARAFIVNELYNLRKYLECTSSLKKYTLALSSNLLM